MGGLPWNLNVDTFSWPERDWLYSGLKLLSRKWGGNFFFQWNKKSLLFITMYWTSSTSTMFKKNGWINRETRKKFQNFTPKVNVANFSSSGKTLKVARRSEEKNKSVGCSKDASHVIVIIINPSPGKHNVNNCYTYSYTKHKTQLHESSIDTASCNLWFIDTSIASIRVIFNESEQIFWAQDE